MQNRGKLNEEIKEKIVERLIAHLRPHLITLFGSYAEGKATEDSDIDLLVITEVSLSPEERYRLSREFFADLPCSVHLITMDPQEFAETRDVIGGIAYPANKYGVILYEKS